MLERIRPQLKVDGGDLQLVDVSDGIVTIRMVGGCCGCPFTKLALMNGLEKTIMEQIAGVRQVKLVKG
ncbi:MAG TPA: NifU family protein [Haliangiales bacterium]|nr:NifU family protein [Haliangiales bacterium]